MFRPPSRSLRSRLAASRACLALGAAALLAAAVPAQQGSLDTTFDGDGKAVVPLDWGGGYFDIAYDVAIQLDGKIVVVGSAIRSAYDHDFAIVRLNQNGSLDSGFGSGGKVGVAFDLGGHLIDGADGVAIQGDGKIIVAGSVETAVGDYDFGVVRLNSDGSLDSTFGSGGKVLASFDAGGNYSVMASDVSIQNDGKIVVVGTRFGGPSDFAAVRLTASGSLDNTFGSGGKVVVDLNGGDDDCEAVALQPDGKIVLAGSTAVGSGNDQDFAVVRLNSNGSLDSTFGYGMGWTSVFFDAVPAGRDEASAVALDASGRILVAGRAGTCTIGGQAFAIARLTSSGTPDSSFGNLGKTTLSVPAGSGIDEAFDIAQAANGKIVVAGWTEVGAGDAEFSVARLLSDGSLDAGFGNGGVTLVPFDYGQSNGDRATAMALQTDGDIVVAGWVERASPGDLDFAVARLVGEPFFSSP